MHSDGSADTATPSRAPSLGRRGFLGLGAVAAATAVTTLWVDPASAATTLAETSAEVQTVEQAKQQSALSAWGGYANGQIPASAMMFVSASVNGSGFLRWDAAKQYLAMSMAFSAALGKPLQITEGYRNLATQQDYWNKYQAGTGNLAAYPGTSNHGWGISCDFGSRVDVAGSPEKRWMDANGPSYGWQPTGNGFSRPEPWHFDFSPAYPGPPAPRASDDDPEVVIIRNNQALVESPVGYTALVGFRLFRHLSTTDMVNAVQLAGLSAYDLSRQDFYGALAALSIPRSAIKSGSNYYAV